MDLIGDLSSARLRDEVVALLNEEKVDFALRRLEQLGVTASIHARLSAGAEERALIRRSDDLRGLPTASRGRCRPGACASCGCCGSSRRRRSRRGRGACASSGGTRRCSSGPSSSPSASSSVSRGARPRLSSTRWRAASRPRRCSRRWLSTRPARRPPASAGTWTSSRHVRLEIGGRDLLALGFTSSPRMGDVLRSVLRLKLNGVLAGRDQELAAAARLQGGRGAAVGDSQLLLEFVIVLPLLLFSLVRARAGARLGAAALGDDTARAQGRLSWNPLRQLDPFGTLVLVATFIGSGGSFFFGWARPVPISPWRFRDPQRGMMAVGAAGPLANVALAAVSCALVWAHVHGLAPRWPRCSPSRSCSTWCWPPSTSVPIPPLDGSRVLGGLLPPTLWARWMELDRFGNYVFILLFVVLVSAAPAVRGHHRQGARCGHGSAAVTVDCEASVRGSVTHDEDGRRTRTVKQYTGDADGVRRRYAEVRERVDAAARAAGREPVRGRDPGGDEVRGGRAPRRAAGRRHPAGGREPRPGPGGEARLVRRRLRLGLHRASAEPQDEDGAAARAADPFRRQP